MVSTQTKAMTVALPTSLSFLARPEMATAPSMPRNTQMVTIMVPLTCSKNVMPSIEPCAMFSMKMFTSNFWKKMMAVSATKMGTNLLMVMIRLTPAASFTPRLTKNA